MNFTKVIMEDKLSYINFDNISIGIYKDGPVGISVSGGADSSALLYVLMKHVEHDLHIFQLLPEYRRLALESPFDRVLKKCSELTGKKNYFIHKLRLVSAAPEMLFKVYKEHLDNKTVDIVYTGITKFPPDEVYENWDEKLPSFHVDFRRDKNIHPLFGIQINIPAGTDCGNVTIGGEIKDKIVSDKRVYSPLINNNKRDVAKIYRFFNVEKELFPVTRSCENDKHLDSHCGKCWWCQERIWGFGYLE